MAGELLMDTGPLVSLLDADQSTHDLCVEYFSAWHGPVLTTEAVVTEASHLLGNAAHQCVRFVLTGAVTVVPSGRDRYERVLQLLEKYAGVPMDYADATLVALAEEIRADRIFTLDRRGFSIYRWNRRQVFRICP